eukprot:TRINITY_DN2651_c0_g1_i1.p2 TRINITY_DN2651_c0_g1~~TRINITY_DN2651_c0_g1_i1.p2  ORF type:complete len:264 (+),score=60.29 TRINITY_DN2651_c0_g1_i1:1194-1985(+)
METKGAVLKYTEQTRKTILHLPLGTDVCPSATLSLLRRCHVYLLDKLEEVSVNGCQSGTVFVGATNTLHVQRCEGIVFIAAVRSIIIEDCKDCIFHLCTMTSPLLDGSNVGILLAPYNSFYGTLQTHLELSEISTTLKHNMWNKPVNSSNEKIPVEQSTIVDSTKTMVSIMIPEDFTPFSVPFSTPQLYHTPLITSNPFELPKEYSDSLKKKSQCVSNVRAALSEGDPNSQTFLQKSVEAKFQEWLIESGNINQINDLLSFKR